VRILANPKCFKCDAPSVHFGIWMIPLSDKGKNIEVKILYCMKCGATQGIIGVEAK